ncbi:MAG: outer membrane beta-barrel protein, partial [Bacteroidia bacterium]
MFHSIQVKARSALFLCLFIFTYTSIFAQISGIVTDSINQKPLVYATVALFRANDSTNLPIQGAFTDDKGAFSFEKMEKGKYRVEVAMTEYNAYKSEAFEISESQNRKELGTIRLKTAETQLAAVVIEGQRPIIESKEDKLIYNVENDMLAQSGTTIEVMKRVPFVSVDQDDKIRVKGQTSFKVLVNGKATGIISRNPSEALKAFPANAIKKIEVITSPSAKYDAEGASAVLNIITKKQLSGYNGGANASINTFKQGWGNLYFNMKQGNFGASGYAGLSSWGGVPNTSNSYRKSLVESNLYTQYTTGTSIYHGLGAYGNIELAYDIDTLKSLSLYGNPNFWSNANENNSDFKQIGTQNEIQRSSTFFNESAGLNTGSDVGLDYVQKFGNVYSEHELSFSFLYNQDNNNDSSYSKNSDSYGLAREFKNRNLQKNNETTAAIDYAKPLKHSQKIGFGTKAIFRQNEANYGNYLLDSTSSVYQINPALSNEFTYQQGIYA